MAAKFIATKSYQSECGNGMLGGNDYGMLINVTPPTFMGRTIEC